MTNIKAAWFFSLFFLASGAMAGTLFTQESLKGSEFSVAIGPNWSSVQNTHLIVSPYETDSLRVNNVSSEALWNVGIGYHLFEDQLKERDYFNDLLLQFNFYHLSTTVSGVVWQYQLPQFNNYTFSAPVTSNRLMIDVLPRLFAYRNFSLYAILGAGVAWNTAFYYETVTGAGVDPSSGELTGNHTDINAAYELGLSMKAEMDEHWGAFLEYLYANLGNVSPSSASENLASLSKAPTFSMRNNQAVLVGLYWKI